MRDDIVIYQEILSRQIEIKDKKEEIKYLKKELKLYKKKEKACLITGKKH